MVYSQTNWISIELRKSNNIMKRSNNDENDYKRRCEEDCWFIHDT